MKSCCWAEGRREGQRGREGGGGGGGGVEGGGRVGGGREGRGREREEGGGGVGRRKGEGGRRGRGWEEEEEGGGRKEGEGLGGEEEGGGKGIYNMQCLKSVRAEVANSLQLVSLSWFLDLHFRVCLMKGVLPDGVRPLVHQCVHHLECVHVCVCVDVHEITQTLHALVTDQRMPPPPHTPPSALVANYRSAVTVCGRYACPGYGGCCNTHHTPAPHG